MTVEGNQEKTKSQQKSRPPRKQKNSKHYHQQSKHSKKQHSKYTKSTVSPKTSKSDEKTTPSLYRGKQHINFDQETLDVLGWDKLLDFFASLCRTSWGHKKAKNLPFLASYTQIQRELQQTQEAIWLFLERVELLPISNIEDLSPAFQRLEKGGTLDGHDFLEIANSISIASQLRQFLSHFKEEVPHLWERGELLEPLNGLKKEIERIIGENGQLRDNASWELESMRREMKNTHDRIRRKLQQYLTGSLSQSLTDTYYTLREDRYVLPVKASDKKRFQGGIVYGSSATGQTIYIEPQPLVELNNALRMAENDVAQEELRLLRQLSLRTKSHLDELISNLEIVRDLDLIQARVQFANKMKASIPEIVAYDDEMGFDLKKFRHPLLILKDIKVIPNDLQLTNKQRTLVISGPNTGGKTVALKMLGLSVLMARAALPIPAEQGSKIPLINALFTDIGDRQSIEQDLSTFSAQILKLHSILEKSDPQTLVLIDEIVVGTDPNQGSSLATAILLELAERHAFVAVTTHYEHLKMLPYENQQFINASVGFDHQKLEPTYHLYMGTPGTSNAIQIARKLGMPESVLNRVDELLSNNSERLDKIVSKLEQQYQEIYEERERATRARRRIEKQLLELQNKEEELEKLRRRLIEKESNVLNKELQDARKQLKTVMHDLKHESKDLNKIHKVHQQLNHTQQEAKKALAQIQQEFQQSPPPQAKSLKIGQKVQIISLKTTGEILSLPDSNDQIKIQVGVLRMRLPLSDLRLPNQHTQVTHPKKLHKSIKRENNSEKIEERSSTTFIPVQSRDNTCDLRGLTIEDALDTTEAFLDQALHQERDAVFIIHGHGTGALRKAIRQYVQSSPYIRFSRPGERGEGGNGVTVVQLTNS